MLRARKVDVYGIHEVITRWLVSEENLDFDFVRVHKKVGQKNT